MKSVPIIDLRSIDDDALSEIDAACRDHGFFLLIGHGLNDKIDAVLKLAEAFFTAPRSFKNSLRKSEGDVRLRHNRNRNFHHSRARERLFRQNTSSQRSTVPVG